MNEPFDWKLNLLVHGLFLGSGASSLAYEIIWTRQFALVTGATTPAVSVVLALFMGGLALGAWVFGRVASRGGNLLRWYGAMECGIAIFALIQPSLLATTGGWYLHALPGLALHGMTLLLVRVIWAGALLLVPTILMGGTFPVLVQFIANRQGGQSRPIGTLYGANLLGAVVGTLLTGFVLIRQFGVQGTLLGAVALNLWVGLTALVLSKKSRSGPKPGEDPQVLACKDVLAPEVSPTQRGILWALVLLSGFLTMAYEVAWTRMLVFSFFSTVYTFTLILAVFLLGLSAGSFLFLRLAPRFQGIRILCLCLGLSAWTSLGLAVLVGFFPKWQQIAPSFLRFSGVGHLAFTLMGSGAVMLIPVTLMGVVFPLASRMLMGSLSSIGRGLGRVYLVNTLGATLGSLLTGFVLLPLFHIKGCLLVLAGAQLLLAAWLLSRAALNRRYAMAAWGSGVLITALAAGTYLVGLPGPNPFDSRVRAWPGLVKVEAHQDDPAGSVTVVSTSAGRMLRINGFMATSDYEEAGYMPMMSHLPILLHGDPHRVLVICVGTGATAGAALLHPGVQVDAVDINATVLEDLPFFDHVNNGLAGNPRCRLIHDDGRNFLLRTRTTYDVITSEPMPPTHAGVVNLYSQEYYELAKARLNPGGMLVQWLPAHLVHPMEARSILRSIQNVFPETTLWMHSRTALIVARKDAPVQVSIQDLSRRLQEPALAGEYSRMRIQTVESFLQLFQLGPEGVRELVGGAPPVTDDDPSLEFHPPRSQIEPLLGGKHILDWWLTTLKIYEIREHQALPIAGASPREALAFQASFRLRSLFLEGNLWLDAHRHREAERYFQEGLSMSSNPFDRGEFLFRLALTAQEAGNQTGAMDLVARSLEASPGKATALALQRELLSGPR